MEQAKKLLFDILSIKSVNHCDDEGKVAEYLFNYFKEAGAEGKVHRIDETHANFQVFIPGRSHERHMLWNGHMDTVPYGNLEEWHTDPADPVEKDGKIYGRGACDMKGGLCAMAYTLVNIIKSGRCPAYDITFVGTCDEESTSIGVKTFAASDAFPKVSEVLIGEPTGLNIGIAQKGCLWLEIDIFGKASHGSYPEKGVNAIEYGMKIATELKKRITEGYHELLGYATAQVTKISGGETVNVTPDKCTISMDIRFVPGQDEKVILNWLSDISEKYIKETNGELRIEKRILNSRVAVNTDSEDNFTLGLKHVIEAHGVQTGNIGINFYTDGSAMVVKHPELKILLFGPGEPDMCHKVNECIELKQYEKAIEILTAYALGETDE